MSQSHEIHVESAMVPICGASHYRSPNQTSYLITRFCFDR